MTLVELKELEKYAKLEGSELGEIVDILLCMKESYLSELSDDFIDVLEKELKFHLNNFRSNCKIVKKEVIITNMVEELDWTGSYNSF